METTTPQEAGRPIRAAVARAFATPLSMETILLPAPPAGTLRVRLTALAICGSDLTFLSGAWGGALPALYGHEAAGIVEAIGAGVSRVSIGTRVAAGLLRWCGACRACANARITDCQSSLPPDAMATIRDQAGKPVWQAMAIGAFAEAILVHESQVMPLPDSVSDEAGALMACGGITGFGSVRNLAQVQAGESVLVVGAGGVGLNCIQAAALIQKEANTEANKQAGTGARARTETGKVIALDRDGERATAAQACGADTFILMDEDENAVAGRVRQALGGEGADHLFLAVGVASLVPFALSLLRRGGTLTLVGMAASSNRAEFDMTELADSGKRILGSKMGKPMPEQDFPTLYKLIGAGKLQIAPLIAARRPFAEINDAIAAARTGGGRQVLTFD